MVHGVKLQLVTMFLSFCSTLTAIGSRTRRTGTPGCSGREVSRLQLSAQVTVSGLRAGAPCKAPRSAGSLPGSLPFPLPLPTVYAHSLENSKNKKDTKPKNARLKTEFVSQESW